MGDYITKKNLGDAPGREKALAEKDPFKKPEYITKKEKKKDWITKKEKKKDWITKKKKDWIIKKDYPKIGEDY